MSAKKTSLLRPQSLLSTAVRSSSVRIFSSETVDTFLPFHPCHRSFFLSRCSRVLRRHRHCFAELRRDGRGRGGLLVRAHQPRLPRPHRHAQTAAHNNGKRVIIAFRFGGVSRVATFRKFFQRVDGPCIDVGAFAAALKFSTNCEVLNIGKPSRFYFEQGINALGLKPEEVCLDASVLYWKADFRS